jgi:hypothetical protein
VSVTPAEVALRTIAEGQSASGRPLAAERAQALARQTLTETGLAWSVAASTPLAPPHSDVAGRELFKRWN